MKKILVIALLWFVLPISINAQFIASGYSTAITPDTANRAKILTRTSADSLYFEKFTSQSLSATGTATNWNSVVTVGSALANVTTLPVVTTADIGKYITIKNVSTGVNTQVAPAGAVMVGGAALSNNEAITFYAYDLTTIQAVSRIANGSTTGVTLTYADSNYVMQLQRNAPPTVNDFFEEGAEWIDNSTTPPTGYKLMDAVGAVVVPTPVEPYNNLSQANGSGINATNVKRGQTFTVPAAPQNVLNASEIFMNFAVTGVQVTAYIFLGNQTGIDPAIGTAVATSNVFTNTVTGDQTVAFTFPTTVTLTASTQYTIMVVRTGGINSTITVLSGQTDAFAGEVSSVVGAIDFKVRLGFTSAFTAGTNKWVKVSDIGNQWNSNTTSIYPVDIAKNVGIGTITPTQLLTVNGNIQLGTTATSAATATPIFISSGGTFGNSAAGSPANLKWKIFDNGTPASSYGIGMSSNLMEFRAAASGGFGFFPNNGVEAMRIAGTGNVGVGTNIPTSKLHVIGSQAGTFLNITAATTLTEQTHIWAAGATTYLVTLPAASTCTGRIYTITNTQIAKTISTYSTLANVASTTLPLNTTITLVSTGTVWKQF